MYIFLFCVIFAPLSLVFSDEYFLQFSACCTFKGQGFDDIEYDIVNRVNNKVLIEYNSTRGNWTGYTPFAKEIAEVLNNDPAKALQIEFRKKLLCTDNVNFVKQASSNLTAAPTIRLNSVKHPPMLVCSAYNFYPKQIKVTWLRNGQEVTSAVSFSEVLPDGEWYYQIHSYLQHTPTPGETITCMVEHLSLSEPVLHVWDPSLPVSERNKIVMGTFLLVLGLISMSSGFIYYKKKSGTDIIPCQGRVLIPVDDLPAAGAT